MTDPDLAIEHLRMTLATSRAVEAAQTVVNVNELAELLTEHDRLATQQPAGEIWAPPQTEWTHGTRDNHGGTTIWPATTQAVARSEVARLRRNPKDGVHHAVLRRQTGPTIEDDGELT